MALTLNNIVPIAPDSPRKHTEKHGIFINHIDVFREIRCDSVAIDQDQGSSQCHWEWHLTYVMSSPLTSNSPRKHTEKHGIVINHSDIFRVIRCDSVAIDQDQGLSQCHWG